MLFAMETDIGKIEYDKKLIAHIALILFSKMNGKVLPAYHKGKQPRQLIRGENYSADFVKCTLSGERLDIKIYINLIFGTSISETVKKLDADFRSQIPKIVGLNVGECTIAVNGVISKNFSKRNLEVTTYA
ncbi:MAG: Asp23/Gls24 family envelope stress response protein [Clostridiales Family XIII bacterium]|jgi:uncharacterized alkaline shock family protein YloU|nr:Asp23/Gls24 family envelope stress response protein [Clostridiales Family XIII bacterium]